MAAGGAARRRRQLRPIYLLVMGLVVLSVAMIAAYPSVRSYIAMLSWFARPRTAVIPVAYQGLWVERGDECGDRDATLRISDNSVNYDRLAFIAERIVKQSRDELSLAGSSYKNGDPREITVLLHRDGMGSVRINAPDLRHDENFDLCR